MPATTSLGQRGEKAVETCLCRPSANTPEYQFRPIPLGEKAELFDFLVHLLDASNNIIGPHFFVQVKTTAAAAVTSCNARFDKSEVAKAITFNVPSYVIAVDASSPTTERIFIKAINSDRTAGIAKVACTQSLDDDAVRDTLYQEVMAYFSGSAYTFTSSLSK